jgi:hypothetical protein
MRKHQASTGFNWLKRKTRKRFNQKHQESAHFLTFQQAAHTWFGTRRPEVQILSPRFFLSVRYSPFLTRSETGCSRFCRRNFLTDPHVSTTLEAPVKAADLLPRPIGVFPGKFGFIKPNLPNIKAGAIKRIGKAEKLTRASVQRERRGMDLTSSKTSN